MAHDTHESRPGPDWRANQRALEKARLKLRRQLTVAGLLCAAAVVVAALVLVPRLTSRAAYRVTPSGSPAGRARPQSPTRIAPRLASPV